MSEPLEALASVVRLEGDIAWVATQRRSACDHCQVSRHCGSGALAALLGKPFVLTPVDNHVRAAVGDQLVIGLGNDALLCAALGAYLVPLLVLIAFAAVVKLAGFGDGATAAAALTGLAAGLWVVGRWMRDPSRAGRFRPQVLRRGMPAGTSKPVSGKC